MTTTGHNRSGSFLREVEVDASADILSGPLGAPKPEPQENAQIAVENGESVQDDGEPSHNVGENALDKIINGQEIDGTKNEENTENGVNGGGGEGEEDWATYNDIMLGNPVSPSSPGSLSEITPADEVNGQALPESLSQSEAPVQVWVGNPKQVEETTKLGIRSQYTTYFVRSQTSLPTFPFKQRAVWRRFRDFDTLHRVLRSNHRGYFCPPLPGKNFIEGKRAKEDFIKIRQADLNKFIRQLMLHPVLYHTEEVKMFLGIPEELTLSHEWHTIVQSAGKNDNDVEDVAVVPNPPAAQFGNNLMKKMREMGNSFKKEVLKRSSSIPEEEKRLKEVPTRLRVLGAQLNVCCQRSKSLIVAYESVTEELLKTGKAFVSMARFEETSGTRCGQYTETGRLAASRAADLQKAGYAALRVHQFYKKSTVLSAGWLMTFHDQASMVPAALSGMNDREAALNSREECEQRLEMTRGRLGALTRDSSKKLGGVSNFAVKHAQLTSEINSIVSEVKQLSDDYCTVRTRNEEELERLDTSRREDLYSMVRGLAQVQAELYESAAVAWKGLAEQLAKSAAQ